MKQIELTPAYKETLLGSLINTSSEELQKVNNRKSCSVGKEDT